MDAFVIEHPVGNLYTIPNEKYTEQINAGVPFEWDYVVINRSHSLHPLNLGWNLASITPVLLIDIWFVLVPRAVPAQRELPQD